MTVTHPHHPLYNHQVTVVRVRRGFDPDLIIRYPDGFYGAISASWTDYAAPRDTELVPDAPPLLDLLGLYQIAQLVAQLRDRPTDEHSSTSSRANPRYAEGEQL